MAITEFILILFFSLVSSQIVNQYKWVNCMHDYDICIICECRCKDVSQQLSISCENRSISSLNDGLISSIEELKSNLTFLDFSHNKLTKIPPKSFKGLNNVKELGLSYNELEVLHKNSFAGLSSVSSIILDKNKFKEFPIEAFLHKDLKHLANIFMDSCYLSLVPGIEFSGLHHLETLSLEDNSLITIPYAALSHLTHLRELKLSMNLITEIQPFTFKNNSFLQTLSLSHNGISFIPNNAFAGSRHLTELELDGNPIANIGLRAFNSLPALKYIKMSGVTNLRTLPDLTGTVHVEEITFHSCNITSIPEDFCTTMGDLAKLDLYRNHLETIPTFIGCTNLVTLNFGFNKIVDVANSSFIGPDCLLDLVLKYNEIAYIHQLAFHGLHCLENLDLSGNKITAIHEDAFRPLQYLHSLNLANNRFKVMPSAGLLNLVELFTAHNPELNNIPPPEELPMIRHIKTSYAYHCCQYFNARHTQSSSLEDRLWLVGPSQGQYPEYVYNHSDWDYSFSTFDGSTSFDQLHQQEMSGIDMKGSIWGTSWSELEDTMTADTYNITCHPEPGPFVPCDDIFESWYLRLGVWMVFVLALTGNVTVLVVNIFSKTKMDVSRFLICNLACADFIMGLYLGFLAIVDITSLGEFEKIGVEWQRSAACKITGFLGVLSSELSIYTLSVITLERFYTLKYALYSKRLKLKGAVIIMGFGWLFALVMASLPLSFVSQYVTVVCLPMDVQENVARIAVLCVIILNATSFIVIMCCYASIYYSIQGSSAWNSKDSLIAKRMSILVFTDFACWAPVVFFAITALFDVQLISLYGAKVLTVFVLPVNSCANPFLYTLLTKQFKSDCKTIGRKIWGMICQRRHPRPSITIGNQVNGNENFDRVVPLNGNPYLQRYDNMPVSDGGPNSGDLEEGCPQGPSPSQYDTTENGAKVSAERDGNYLDLMACPDLDIIRRGSGSPLLERHDGSFRPSQFSSGRVKSKRKKFLIPFLSWRGDHRFNRTYSNKDWDGSSLRNNKQMVRRSVSMSEGMLASKQLGQADPGPESKGNISTTPESSSEGRSGDVSVSACSRPKSPQVLNQTPQRSPEHRSNRSPVHLWIPRSPLSKKPKAGTDGKELTTNSENTTEFSLTEFEEQETDSTHHHESQTEQEDTSEPTSSLLQENNNGIDCRKKQESPKHGQESNRNGNLSSILERLQGEEEEEQDTSESSSSKLLGQSEQLSTQLPKESLV